MDIRISELFEEAKYHEEHRNKIAAIKLYEQIIDLDPANLDAWLNKGKLHIELNHSNSASICLDKVLEIDSSNQDALALRKKLKISIKEKISKNLYRSEIYVGVGFLALLGGIVEIIFAIMNHTNYLIITATISIIVGIAWINITRRFRMISDYIDIFTEIS